MTRDEITAIVLKELARVAPEVNSATLDTRANLREQVDLDSMDFLNLLIAVGEKLSLQIPESDYPRLASIDACVDYLADRTASR